MDVSSFLLESGAVATFSLTVTRSKLLTEVREKMKGKPRELLKCPYCMAHWAAIAATLDTNVPHFARSRIDDYFAYWLAFVASSSLIMGVIMRLFLSQESKIEELESDLEQATELLKNLDTGVPR